MGIASRRFKFSYCRNTWYAKRPAQALYDAGAGLYGLCWCKSVPGSKFLSLSMLPINRRNTKTHHTDLTAAVRSSSQLPVSCKTVTVRQWARMRLSAGFNVQSFGDSSINTSDAHIRSSSLLLLLQVQPTPFEGLAAQSQKLYGHFRAV